MCDSYVMAGSIVVIVIHNDTYACNTYSLSISQVPTSPIALVKQQNKTKTLLFLQGEKVKTGVNIVYSKVVCYKYFKREQVKKIENRKSARAHEAGCQIGWHGECKCP